MVRLCCVNKPTSFNNIGSVLKKRKKLVLNVKVQPQAGKTEIVPGRSGEYRIKVNAPPERGKANREVIKLIASFFECPVSCVRIIRGEKSRSKVIMIEIP